MTLFYSAGGIEKQLLQVDTTGIGIGSIADGDEFNINCIKGDQYRIQIQYSGSGGQGGLSRGTVNARIKPDVSSGPLWVEAGKTIDGSSYTITKYIGVS